MGAIKVQEHTTIDGVIDEPFWAADFPFTQEMVDSLTGVTSSCSAILLGRNSYEMFHPSWSSPEAADDPFASSFNDTPKYVVSSTLESADWGNSTILGGYDVEAIRKFKDSVDGGIFISASGRLVRALLADGLVDELHLFVYPVAIGHGARLFPEGAPRTVTTLAGCTAFDSGVVHLTYQPTANK